MQDDVTKNRERLSFIWLELTARCNLECVHCYADSSPERRSPKECSVRTGLAP